MKKLFLTLASLTFAVLLGLTAAKAAPVSPAAAGLSSLPYSAPSSDLVQEVARRHRHRRWRHGYGWYYPPVYLPGPVYNGCRHVRRRCARRYGWGSRRFRRCVRRNGC